MLQTTPQAVQAPSPLQKLEHKCLIACRERSKFPSDGPSCGIPQKETLRTPQPGSEVTPINTPEVCSHLDPSAQHPDQHRPLFFVVVVVQFKVMSV